MAIVYLPHSTFAHGQVVVDIKVNDANWNVSAVRCVNNSDNAVVVDVYDDGVHVWTQTFPANDTKEQNVSGIGLDWQPDYWNDDTEEWEAGGVEMGTYTFNARLPP